MERFGNCTELYLNLSKTTNSKTATSYLMGVYLQQTGVKSKETCIEKLPHKIKMIKTMYQIF